MADEIRHILQGLEFEAKLTKTPENVTCAGLSKADETYGTGPLMATKLELELSNEITRLNFKILDRDKQKNLNDILLAMSEHHTGSEKDAREAIAAIYDAGMMIVDQTRAGPKMQKGV